jgi:hypothetical protein
MPINPFDTSYLQGGINTGQGVIPTFGVPPCLLNIGFDILALLPGDALGSIANGINSGVVRARTAIADTKGQILGALGFEDKDGDGQYRLGLDTGQGGLGEFADSALGALGQVAGIVQGAQEELNATINEINQIIDCIDSFRNEVSNSVSFDSTSTSPDNATEQIGQQVVAGCQSFIADAAVTLSNITEVLRQRAAGTLADPDDVDPEDDSPIFRLTFGPPVSKKGSFLLSVDGLYYDSQGRSYEGGEVPSMEDIGFVPNRERWTLDHAPSLGGKGTQITLGDVSRYVDTLFDIEITDESEALQAYYDKDHTLGVIKGNKSKFITDLEKQRKSLIASGYEESSAIVQNMQQQIFSQTELFDIKIRKRKKQIEVAVKAPDFFGYDGFFEKGTIPVNDFSYLGGLNLSPGFEKQKSLVLDHGEVSGVILPLKPVFVKPLANEDSVSLLPLNIAPIGTGVFADVTDTSSTTLPAITISDSVVADKLIAIYSFLDADVQRPESKVYNVISCNSDSTQDAQLVGSTASAIFASGLGIPLLKGIVEYTTSGDFVQQNRVGSYLRLPASKKMQDLMFNLNGCSFDFWLHMDQAFGANNIKERTGSNLKTNNTDTSAGAFYDYNYYKIILSNENTGGDYTVNADTAVRNRNSDTVRGMLMGFTRDPQWTTDSTKFRGTDTDIAAGFTSIDTSNTTSAVSFFIAPTQSVNGDDITFVRSSECDNDLKPFDGMTISTTKTTSSGYKLNDLSSGFVHMNISFDVQADEVKVFLNSELLETCSLSVVFGTDPGVPARVPSFIKTGDNDTASFYYASGTTENVKTSDFNQGPGNDPFFTPWIFGGGWTDGLPVDYSTSSGGFMSESRGLFSGLGGRIGSLKIYEKPLTTSEVLFNYNAHKAFFNNIKI